MTREEFLTELNRLGHGKFILTPWSSQIRAFDEKGASYCPITFVCSHLKDIHFIPTQYPSAAKELGIEHALMNSIVDAADKAGNRTFRPELMRALGIK